MNALKMCLILLAGMCPVLAQPDGRITIKLYFHNEKLNPNMEDCNKVFPVTRRIPRTTGVARAALEELFRGTTAEEESRKFSGFPPADTAGILKSVNVKNGAAYVNFTSRMFEQMGNATTSCGGSAFFSMVEKTLMQFPTIKKVYYAVDGNTDEFYEWVQVGECPYGRRHCARSNFK
jgi:spore germination protein GerM